GTLTYASGDVAEGIWKNGILTAPPDAPAPAPAEPAPAEPATAPAEAAPEAASDL
ncbi:MAG TPA: 2-isopropylmalate synthase, partial [Tabrizicola sp.]|nr:2-isopropylmalate synthase [Tabrizicola sp.]